MLALCDDKVIGHSSWPNRASFVSGVTFTISVLALVCIFSTKPCSQSDYWHHRGEGEEGRGGRLAHVMDHVWADLIHHWFVVATLSCWPNSNCQPL